jgi:hypothetical protein
MSWSCDLGSQPVPSRKDICHVVRFARTNSETPSPSVALVRRRRGDPIAADTGTKDVTSGHTIVYAVTGHGGVTDVTYTTDGSTTTNQESNPALPWSKTINLSADQAIEIVQVMAQGGSDASSVAVTITVNGKLVKTASATGYGVAS